MSYVVLGQPESDGLLNDVERLAVELGNRFACDHFAIDDGFFDDLKSVFSEAQIMELLMHCGLFVGMGRLAVILDMTEELPNGFSKTFGREHVVTPTSDKLVLVR